MPRLFEVRPAVVLLLVAIVPCGCSILGPDKGPTAAFQAATRSGVAPLQVQFTDQSRPGSADITEWTWRFGDGEKSSERSPVHVYQEPGTYSVSLVVTTKVGIDTEAKTNYITVSPTVGPNAEFVGTPRSGGKPLSVQFTDQSNAGSGTITSWSWTFGDGGTSTEKNPAHVYESDGAYDVSLTVQTSVGSNTETKSGYIAVSTAPTAQFTGTPRSGPKPLTVQFTDQSIPGSALITGWAWSFGDGETSTAQNPSHTYAAAGSYSVSLTVTTAAGVDTEEKPGYILASDPVLPTAAFSGTPRSGIRPLEVDFTDQSNSGSFPITAWSWSFGDGGTSTSQNPTHTYAAAGSYDVTLTITTSAGSDSDTKAAYVVVSNPVPPTAGFTGTPRSGSIPLNVQFTDQSAQGSFPITSWSWSFGDGATSTSQNPSHTYTSAGTYTVSLTVTTAAGTDGETKTGYIVATQPPEANFEGSPRTGDRPLTVEFSDLSTEGSAPITAWSWTFGDDGTSTSQNPSHTYLVAGTYTVALTVTTSDGSDTATKAGYITVSEPPAPPTADFSGSPTSGPAPLTVQFTDLSLPGTAPITSWLWSFGDTGTSTAENPSHVYLFPGTYAVALTVTTADGTDSATKEGYITVCAAPIADFLAVPTTGLAPLTVEFTDLSLPGDSPITSWSWTFGDGGTSTEQNPAHDYAAPGTYTVSLSVSNGCGSDIETKSGHVVVQDACDTAGYTIADAFVETRADGDNDACAERARVHFDANVDADCSRSVFAKVLVRPEGATEWTVELLSACYTITGSATADDNWIQVQNLPQNFYELRVELYECGGTVPVASRDFVDDPDLDNRCFE